MRLHVRESLKTSTAMLLEPASAEAAQSLSSLALVVHGPSTESSKRVHHHQNIVYSASIHQAKLHSDINDGDLLHQGFLWKRDDTEVETRYWALLFSDALLLTHVREIN